MKKIMKQSFCKTISLIRSDMQFRCVYEHKKLNAIQAFIFLFNHSVMSQVFFRLQGFFFSHHLSFIASVLESISGILFTVRIDSSVEIDEGFLLLHANYVSIGKNVKLGKRCVLTQQISIGPAYTMDALNESPELGPKIGDEVLIGVGASIFGNIEIGSNSTIGINSAVDKSFPSKSVLIGVPAKNMSLG